MATLLNDASHHLVSWTKTLDRHRVIHLPAVTFDAFNASAVLEAEHVNSNDLGFAYRASLDRPYCEGKYGGIFYGGVTSTPVDHFPERGSVLSAPFILLCGMHMMFSWRHESGLLHVIAALFTVNGVAAFAAHYHGTRAWHDFDAKSMLLACWLAMGFLGAELFENAFRRFGLMGKRAHCIRASVNATVWILAVLIYWWVAETNMAIGSIEVGTRVGAIAVAAPVAISAMANCCLSCCCARLLATLMGSDAFRTARRRFVWGFSVALLGATAWIVTENLCDDEGALGTAAKWFPGHFIWHVAMSYGMLQCLVFAGALRADNFNARVEIDHGMRGGTSCAALLCRCYFFIFPRLVLTPMHESMGRGSSTVAPMPLRQQDDDHDHTLVDNSVSRYSPVQHTIVLAENSDAEQGAASRPAAKDLPVQARGAGASSLKVEDLEAPGDDV